MLTNTTSSPSDNRAAGTPLQPPVGDTAVRPSATLPWSPRTPGPGQEIATLAQRPAGARSRPWTGRIFWPLCRGTRPRASA